MSDAVTIVFQDKALKKTIEKLEENVNDAKGVDKKFYVFASAIVFREIMNHFKEEQGSKGPWQERSNNPPNYYKDTIEGEGFTKILQVSGNLRKSIMPIRRNSQVRKVKDGLMWYTNAKTVSGFPYAAAHDEGWGKLPKRDFMWLSNKGLDRIAGMTLKKLEDI